MVDYSLLFMYDVTSESLRHKFVSGIYQVYFLQHQILDGCTIHESA